ncbi:PDZ domain-containing protein [Sutcliffiella cohnii]|uniref:PDZ domain-containing protein n=1 Tax=Sutcliffiella cohnii TaxID=33932 RepID=UPI002E23F10B|nr:PDZ domain-containing protein [Sutcliffiella cohnii]
MFEAWGIELLKAIGRFFIHPVPYVIVAVALLLGYMRIKRERYDFHIRVYDIFHELRFAIQPILMGLALSIFTIGLGVIIPFSTLFFISIITVLLALTLRPKWLSASFIFGVTILAILVLPQFTTGVSLIDDQIQSMATTHIPSITFLLATFVIVEGLLIWKQGSRLTTPQLEKSKRGLPVGAHETSRVWLIPLFLFLPGTGLQSTVEWWPVFSYGEQTFSLWIVPFALGFSQRSYTAVPKQAFALTGRQIFALGIVLFLLAVGTIWVEWLTLAAVILAIVGKEWITYMGRKREEEAPPIFVHRDKGLIVLGIIPSSVAEKMNVEIGEIILKVNGITVSSVQQYYEALQSNRALCKLQVLDKNNELRFEQRALYEGEHHELGFLFVQEGKRWKKEAV